MRFLLNPSTDPYYNMAFDQAVLECGPDELVFYLWRNSPAVIIGRNQNPYAEVNLPYLEKNGIALVRRITGGGAVYHDLGNLNYSIVGPTRFFADERPGVIAEALRTMGVPAELGGRNDIYVDGRKCSGYARRLWKDRTMIHGTLMFDVDLEALVSALAAPGSKVSAAGIASVRSRVANLREYLPGLTMDQFTSALQELLAAGDGPFEEISPRGLTGLGRDDKKGGPSAPFCHTEPSTPFCHTEPSERASVSHIDTSKFRSWEWNYGKSPEAAFCKTKRFPCGTVTASYSIVHGLLHEVRFTGDFIGNADVSALEQRLEGRHISIELFTDVQDYFDGLSPIDLYNFLI